MHAMRRRSSCGTGKTTRMRSDWERTASRSIAPDYLQNPENSLLITRVFIGTKIEICMRAVYNFPGNASSPPRRRSPNDNSSSAPQPPIPPHFVIAYVCCCRRWFSNRPRRSIKWVRFFSSSFFIFSLSFFNQINVSCCSFLLFFIYIYSSVIYRNSWGLLFTRRQPSFYLLKPFIYFSVFFSLNFTGRQ